MMFKSLVLLSSCLWLTRAEVTTGRPGHGLIGYGIKMYDPPCAYACRDTLSGSPLSCSEMDDDMDMPGMSMGMSMTTSTSPDCYAKDDFFLQSMAWCISTHCQDLETWRLEKYWTMNIAGHNIEQPNPKETYQEALAKIKSPPTLTIASGDPINQTVIIDPDAYLASLNADINFPQMEAVHEKFALVVFLSGVVIPVGFSLLRFLPWPATWVTKFYAWVIDPPLIGSKVKTPIFGFANVPTRGQGLFIAYLVILNVILSSVGIKILDPNSWWTTSQDEVAAYVGYRTGVLSFANVPLLILYAGRNNILLWITNWSHDTFLLLHRWVAGIATVQACIHSAVFLQSYVAMGTYSTEYKSAYWIWGIVATMGMVVLLPTSLLPIRRKIYELFLAWHVVISVLVVAGCYQHIIQRFAHQWGYETWIWVAMAIWGFDRSLRLLRLGSNGLKQANIKVLDDEYVRVDIPGVHGNGHAYLYFPTLTWRVWENHPFSVASTVLPVPAKPLKQKTSDVEKDLTRDLTKDVAVSEHSASGDSDLSTKTALGLTFLLRTQKGLTSQIRSRLSLPVLVEASYAPHVDISKHTLVIAIAGGVGVTALLPMLQTHPGQRKLFWASRSEAIIREMRPLLKDVETEEFVEKKLNIPDVLERELEDTAQDVVVVVSGPARMADEVRSVVSRIGRNKHGVKVRLIEESFNW